eukprot:2928227-Rhodomonas_salina.1
MLTLLDSENTTLAREEEQFRKWEEKKWVSAVTRLVLEIVPGSSSAGTTTSTSSSRKPRPAIPGTASTTTVTPLQHPEIQYNLYQKCGFCIQVGSVTVLASAATVPGSGCGKCDPDRDCRSAPQRLDRSTVQRFLWRPVLVLVVVL